MSRRPGARWALIRTSMILLACGGCGSSGSSTSGGPPPPPPPVTGSNVITASVNPFSPVCDGVNSLCASVIVCQPNTSNCQTITDLLVDTGAFGLRIFSSALTVSLPAQISVEGPVGECAFFAGLTTWGSVRVAALVLGGEPAVQVPVQVIDPTFAGQYSSTGRPVGNACGVGAVEFSPSNSGFNGILGVGLFKNDGQAYYACNGTSCDPVTLPPSQQVQNPVALLPVDNNGVVVILPGVGSFGAPSLVGSLILGIGTQSNNQPSGVTVYPTNNCGRFITTYKGMVFQTPPGNCNGGAFLDTGSNAYFFPDPSIPPCSFGFFCPPSPLNLTATTTGAFGAPSGVVNFQIANANALFATGNTVFNNLGGSTTGVFDWGLPFFLGRTVFVGIAGQQSVLGVGPYWAY